MFKYEKQMIQGRFHARWNTIYANQSDLKLCAIERLDCLTVITENWIKAEIPYQGTMKTERNLPVRFFFIQQLGISSGRAQAFFR